MGACLHFEPSSRFCLSLNVVNRHATPKAKAVTFFVIALAYWRCAYDFRMQNRNSESSKPGFLSFLHAIYKNGLLRPYFLLFHSLQCVSPLSPITRGFKPNRGPKPKKHPIQNTGCLSNNRPLVASLEPVFVIQKALNLNRPHPSHERMRNSLDSRPSQLS